MDAFEPRLYPKTHQDELEKEYFLPELATIGRHPSNTMVIPLDSISRFHAKIIKRGNYFILQDLGSSNGSFINGNKVREMTLHDKDMVTFGEIEFRFRSNDPEATGSSATGTFSDSTSVDMVEFTDDSLAPRKPMAQKILRREDITSLKENSSFVLDNKVISDQKNLVILNKRLSTLYKLSELLRDSDTMPQDKLVDRALDLIFSSVPADRGVILLRYSKMISKMDIASVRYRDQPITPQKVSISSTILNRVTKEKVAILSQNTAIDDRFDASESIIAQKICSAICVPMVQSNDVTGVVHLDINSDSRQFSAEDLEFVTMIANELALALENTRMRKDSAHRERLAAVGETVAGISHNAKNILLLMKGGSQLLDRAMDRDNLDSAQDSWKIVKRGIDKISTLVSDMLEYSSNKKPSRSMVNINDLICSIAEEVEDRLVQSGVTLELDLNDDLPEYALDSTGIQRTLDNLIVNAMEAMSGDNEHRITVTTSQLDDAEQSLCIKVQDNGSGIPEEKLEKIFLPFFTTKGSTGTGLGLPMCKKVIEDNGGELTVKSHMGEGTTFIIIIPMLDLEASDSHPTLEEEVPE